MSRDEMIALLVCDTLDRIVVMRQQFWLQDILENGFTGFAHWSDEELRRELRGRGLYSDKSINELCELSELREASENSEYNAGGTFADGEFSDHHEDEEYLTRVGYADGRHPDLRHCLRDS